MAKLTKVQIQAIISKLGRECTNYRAKLIEEDKKNYIPSSDYDKFKTLLNERDRLEAEFNAAIAAAKEFADKLGITCYYGRTEINEALEKLKNKEITDKHPVIDLDAAIEDLIIQSIEEDFNIDNFIEHYLKQMKK